MKRVVITGAGTINALGHDVATTLDALAHGRCGIGPLNIRDVDRLAVKIGGQVTGYDEHEHFNRQQISLYDRFTQFTLLAAAQAIGEAGLTFSGELADRSGVVFGTSGGGLNTQDENYRAVYEEGKNRVHPFIVPKLMNNAAASHVSMQYNLRGPSFTVATACASSNHAMGQAFLMIRSGMADVMVTGGSESMLCFGGVKAWEGLRVMSKDVFGRYADDLMISSTKSMHGHLIGGTGAVELLACIMALRDGIIAPTIGYEEADPECALDVVPNVAREAKVSAVLSNAFAFGGLNAVIALKAH